MFFPQLTIEHKWLESSRSQGTREYGWHVEPVIAEHLKTAKYVSTEFGQRDGNHVSSLDLSLESMTSHRSVLGYILLSRSTPATIIRHSGSVFEGEQGRKYAIAIKRMVDTVQSGLEEISGGSNDDLKFMRIRTKRHEILISPDEKYLLAILHDPSIS